MNFPLSLEKKINKFGQKAKIFEKNENAHEIRKKTTVLCPGVIFWLVCRAVSIFLLTKRARFTSQKKFNLLQVKTARKHDLNFMQTKNSQNLAFRLRKYI